MKNFSNETINLRRKAIFKVILKRYSWIIWLPLVLYVFDVVGKIFVRVINDTTFNGTDWSSVLARIMMGSIISFFLTVVPLAIIIFIRVIILEHIMNLIDDIKFFGIKRIFKDFFVETLKDFFKDFFITILMILKSPLTISIILWKRLKDEKRRFNNSLEREMKKQKITN